MAHPPGSTRPARRLLLAALALAAPALAAGVAAQAPAQAAEGDPVLELSAPARKAERSYDNRVFTDFGLRLEVSEADLEIWMQRLDPDGDGELTAYDAELTTTWKAPSGDVPLPEGSGERLGVLADFIDVTITPVADPGATPKVRSFDACLGQWSERVAPEGPARSPYPSGCYYNVFGLGAVQGIAEGWSGSVLDYAGFRLRPGHYDAELSIAAPYADLLGVTEEGRSTTQRLVVRKERDRCRDCREQHTTAAPAPEPAAEEPRGPGIETEADLPPGTPTPDLRALPAFGIGLNKKGTQLRFAANVWNGGTSPLVVDGFRNAEGNMDAYQYFFDQDGEQVAFSQVGEMIWHDDPTHRHWHFTDFATYQLVPEGGGDPVRSGKESFCLANTDAVDLTGEGAEWTVHEDDLGSACGGRHATSIREVLSAGWGDTYAQFRAGQAFGIRSVPDGTYYIRVLANPEQNLVETDLANNESLRRVELSTVRGERRVEVFPVGIIEDDGGF